LFSGEALAAAAVPTIVLLQDGLFRLLIAVLPAAIIVVFVRIKDDVWNKMPSQASAKGQLRGSAWI
jgi:hypothetical protein